MVGGYPNGRDLLAIFSPKEKGGSLNRGEVERILSHAGIDIPDLWYDDELSRSEGVNLAVEENDDGYVLEFKGDGENVWKQPISEDQYESIQGAGYDI